MKRSGGSIQSIGDLDFGDHVALIYRDPEEHLHAVTSFVQQGLLKGDQCLYVVDERSPDGIKESLEQQGLEIQSSLLSGQLAIRTKDEVYVPEGRFDPDTTIRFLENATEAAIRDGYGGLRVTGEMTWALAGTSGSVRLMEYEAKVNQFIGGNKVLALCQYSEPRFPAHILLDVLETHPLVVLNGSVYDNGYYVKYEERFRRKPEGDLTYTTLKHHLVGAPDVTWSEERVARPGRGGTTPMDLETARHLIGWTQTDEESLPKIRPLLESYAPRILEEFWEYLLADRETSAVWSQVPEEAQLRTQMLLRDGLANRIALPPDEALMRWAVESGRIPAASGIPPLHVVSGLEWIRRRLYDLIRVGMGPEGAAVARALGKVFDLTIALVVNGYVEARLEAREMPCR